MLTLESLDLLGKLITLALRDAREELYVSKYPKRRAWVNKKIDLLLCGKDEINRMKAELIHERDHARTDAPTLP